MKEIFEQCRAEGNVVYLPAVQLDRSDYLQVKKVLESNGGKWKGGKVQGFVFPMDAQPILERIQSGDTSNRKKSFQFFETPKDVAHRLVGRLGDIDPFMRFLEPSAGRGALVKAVVEKCPGVVVDCYELMPENRQLLEKVDGARIVGDDFLTADVGMYDRIIANPPFANNQDIKHVLKMWEHLTVGGQMATIMSTHWQFASDKASVAFRSFLEDKNKDITRIEKGAFKGSGTNVETIMLMLFKL